MRMALRQARGGDPREIPAYGMIEVATYLRVPRKTVEYWVSGGKSPLVPLAQTGPARFSFMNLLECHILSAMRIRGVRIPKVRRALQFVQSKWPSDHPLLEQLFQTDGMDLFVEHLPDEIINVSTGGQLGFKSILQAFLERIELDVSGIASRFFPFVADKKSGEPKFVQIDPTVSFGRPVIAGTGITTAIIAARFGARESVAELAKEYGRRPEEIEEAIRWESKAA